MDKQQVREKAAAFLDEIREGVAKILAADIRLGKLDEYLLFDLN